MKRVTGLGGVFLKTKDPKKMKEWYATHLGMKGDEYGFSFQWKELGKEDAKEPAVTHGAPLMKRQNTLSPARSPTCSTTVLKTWLSY